MISYVNFNNCWCKLLLFKLFKNTNPEKNVLLTHTAMHGTMAFVDSKSGNNVQQELLLIKSGYSDDNLTLLSVLARYEEPFLLARAGYLRCKKAASSFSESSMDCTERGQ